MIKITKPSRLHHGVDTVKKAFELHNKGLSNRQVSMEMFGKKTCAGTVHRLLKRAEELVKHNWRSEEELSNNNAKVLLFDLESSASISYHFGRFKVFVGVDQVITRPFLLTIAAQWLNSDSQFGCKLSEDEVLAKDDKALVEVMWKLLDEADIIVAHNAKRFDEALLNTRFLAHGMKPPSSYKVVDTLKIAKKYFKFEANSLDEIADFLGIDRKLPTDFRLWREVMECLDGRIDYMLDYNMNDVSVLKDVYLAIRAWDKTHPSVGFFSTAPKHVSCPCCGSLEYNRLEGKTAKAFVWEYTEYRCNNCGKPFRGSKNIRPARKEAEHVRNIA